MAHCMRQTVIALRLAGLAGASGRELEATYYLGLMMNVYCHADASEQAKWFGDDISLKGDTFEMLDMSTARLVALAAPVEVFARRRGIEAAVSVAGQFLFTVNTASGTISGYQIAANGALSLLPGSTPAGGPSAGAVDARLSPGGGFLYVDQSKTDAVAGFAVHGGRLTQLGASPFPLPAGAAPAGIVVS
jgi:hypothetical protein